MDTSPTVKANSNTKVFICSSCYPILLLCTSFIDFLLFESRPRPAPSIVEAIEPVRRMPMVQVLVPGTVPARDAMQMPIAAPVGLEPRAFAVYPFVTGISAPGKKVVSETRSRQEYRRRKPCKYRLFHRHRLHFTGLDDDASALLMEGARNSSPVFVIRVPRPNTHRERDGLQNDRPD